MAPRRISTLLLGLFASMLVLFAAVSPAFAQTEGRDSETGFVQCTSTFPASGSTEDAVGGSCDLCDVMQLVNNATFYAVSMVMLVATAFVLVSGFLYLTSGGDEHRISQAKNSLKFAVVGMIIALLAGIIVKTIMFRIFPGQNPGLGTFTCTLEAAPPAPGAPGTGEPGTGEPPDGDDGTASGSYAGGKYDDLINNTASKYGFDACAMESILKAENRSGNPDSIGHDPAPRGSNLPNHPNDQFQPDNPPNYGLDWRYSHGIGLSQTTIFPNDRPDGTWCNGDTVPGRTIGGRCYTVNDLRDPATSLDTGGYIFDECLGIKNNDYQAAFACYNGGPRASRETAYAKNAYKEYQACLSKNGGNQ